MFDLIKIFRDGLYAYPKLKGCYSIKKVLPVLVPDLSYDGMKIVECATSIASSDEMFHMLGENELVKKS